MRKLILFFIFSNLILSSEFQAEKSTSKTINKYELWKDELLKIELKDIERKLIKTKSLSVLTSEELNILYQLAEFKNFVQTTELEREMIRAKIYYYYHRGYKRFYFYDFEYRPIFIN